MDCLFCSIINGDIPSSKVYEDEYCYAFKDINPMPIPTVHPMTIELTSIEKQFIIEHDQTSFLHAEYTIYSIDCARGICMNPNCTFMQD